MVVKFRRSVVFCLLLFAAGCTHHYAPNEQTFPIELVDLPQFTGDRAVAVNNARQQASTDYIFWQARGHTWIADLREWTEAAARLVRSELQKKNLRVAEDAPKRLDLRIVSARTLENFWTIRSVVTLEVKTGDGESGNFVGDNKSPATVYRAVDGAVMRAVSLALNSQLVGDYLAE
jgi:hypothetical protein